MIRLTGIRKTFLPGTPDARQIFHDFSLEIQAGEWVTVVGSNGAGKSTLFNLLAGVETPDQGSLWIGPQEITALSEHKRACWINRVFQDPKQGTASSLTVEENLALALRKGENRRLRTCHVLNRDLVATLEMGLEHRLHEPIHLLSGGQRQAITLLMATLPTSRPHQVLLLDEHTAALDPKTEARVLTLTQSRIESQGLTALMITHNLTQALQYGNRILLLRDGKIALDCHGEEKKRLRTSDLLEKLGAEERI